MSIRDEEPLSLTSEQSSSSLIQIQHGTVIQSNNDWVQMLCTSNWRPPSREVFVPITKHSLFPCNLLQKNTSHQKNELTFMHDTQRKVKQTFTWFFLAQIFQIPTTSKETGQSKFWWIYKTLFLHIFYFPQPMLVADDSTKFFHMIRKEVFLPRITTQHWYPYSFDANQVC